MALVVGKAMLLEQRQKLLLEGHLPVMLRLAFDVSQGLVQLRYADTEGALLRLPTEEPVFGKSLLHPLG